MENRIEIILPTGNLQVANDIPMSFNYELADIKDPTKKTGSFSKTISIPGTKENNIIFGGAFDVTSTFEFFNPNLKADCIVMVNTEILMNGYMQLSSIDVKRGTDLEGDEITYNIVIFDKSVDLISKFGDSLLSDLDFSRYDHILSFSAVTNSWNNTPADGYTYPLMYKGSTSVYKTENFSPAIFYKKYLQQMAYENGFSFGGSLMDDTTETGAIFAKEIIPYNGDIPQTTQAELDSRKFRAGLTGATATTINDFSFSAYTSINKTAQVILNDDGTLPNFDNNGNYDTSLGQWVVQKSGHYYLDADIAFKLTFDSSGQTAYYNIPSAGQGEPTGIIPLAPAGLLPNIGVVKLVAKKNGIQVGSIQNNIGVPTNTASLSVTDPYPAFGSVNGYTHERTANLSGSLLIGQQLNVNDVISFHWEFVVLKAMRFQQTKVNTTIIPIQITTEVLEDYNPLVKTNVRNTPKVGSLIDGDLISLSNFIPKEVKCVDLFKDLFNRYNVYVTQDANNTNVVNLDSRNDYYNAGVKLDYSNKKNYDSTDSIKLLAELQSKELDFSYKTDKDYYNTSYQTAYNEVAGRKRVRFNNDFIKNTKKVSSIFSPTLSVTSGPLGAEIIVPGINVTDSINLLAPKTNIRVLYMAGEKPSKSTWTFNYIDASGANQSSGMTTQGQALHTDDPLNPTIDLNFGINQSEFISETYNTTSNNLYERYWRDYVQSINKGKIITSMFKLTEADVAFLRKNMNTKLFIKNSYWIISKIIDFNPTKNGFTKLELIKFTDSSKYTKVRRPFLKPIKDYSEYIGDITGTISISPPIGVGDSRDNIIGNSSAIVIGTGNTVSPTASNSFILGNDNEVVNGSLNSGILGGNNNRVSGTNSFAIGTNNAEILGSNEVWIGDSFKIENGEITSRPEFCTSGITTSSINACYSAGTISINNNVASSTSTATGTTSFAWGNNNTANGTNSFVGGGNNNSASSIYSFIGGGANSVASGYNSAIIGGTTNTASGYHSSVMGGVTNVATGNRSSIVGGSNSVATSKHSGVFVGKNHIASNYHSFVVGGGYAVGLGTYGSTASGINSGVVGGHSNTATGTNSIILGGQSNTASGNNSSVIGGNNNISNGDNSVVIGGVGITGTTDDTVYVPDLNIQADKGISFGSGPIIRTIYSPEMTWDMDANAISPLWSHGLSTGEIANIYEITAIVKANSGTQYTLQGGVNTFVTVNTSDAQANRDTAGQFNTASFNAAKLKIKISYVPD